MSLQFDSRRTASLDGTWEFFPGDHKLAELEGLEPESIEVPGLWEAQGWLELDGWAWYRRTFDLDDVDGFWTLCIGAVMDLAEVYVNGSLVGAHDLPFTPFELDPGPVLVEGRNVLAVRVFDPSLHDPEHLNLPHGKQGWANHVFPSRPSLYMTYGGIWQPVTVRLGVRTVGLGAEPERPEPVGVVDVERAAVPRLAVEIGIPLRFPQRGDDDRLGLEPVELAEPGRVRKEVPRPVE